MMRKTLLIIFTIGVISFLNAQSEDTIKYDGPNSSGFGLLDSGTFYGAVRFHPQQSCTLKAITFYQNQPTVSGCWLYLYEEGQPTYPGPKIDSIFYMGMPGPGSWIRLNFTTPHFRAGGVDFWIGIKISQIAGQTPLGIDSGPSAIPAHSYVSANGSYWRSLYTTGRNNNINIRAIVQYVQFMRDVGIDEILISPFIQLNTTIPLIARVINCGGPLQVFPVACSILGSGGVVRYTYIQNIFAPYPGDTLRVNCGNFTPTITESLTVILSTGLISDEVPANDREVLILGSSGYAENFIFGGGGFIPQPPTGGWELWNGHWRTGPGQYANNANWTLTTPVFIANGANPVFKFWHWYSFEGSTTLYDGGNVKISTNDGQTWSVITPIGGYTGTASSSTPGVGGQLIYGGSSNGWLEATFNLPVTAGQQFRLRWHFGSDGSVCSYPGWYIDDVTGIGFTQLPPSPPPPPILNDIGVQTILSPGTYHIQNTPMIPTARIKNYGILSQTNCPVVCSIVGQSNVLRYTDTQTVNIGASETLRVNFTPWTPTINEVCTVIFRTFLVNDEVPNNDRKTQATTIMNTGYIYIGNATTNARNEPLDRYYNYNTHEVIYLNSEIGLNGSIEQIGYYKESGNNIDPITPVTIYMKQMTDSILNSGTYSLTGYTQVYNGEFPNNATSGWMDVQLGPVFQYDNTSNLAILITKSNQPYISTGYPYWRYTITARYLTRGARGDASQPTNLTQTYNRPNIRFYIHPAIEESDNSKTIPMLTALYTPKPNPITDNCSQISFSLAEPSQVSLKIFDAPGRIIRTLYNNQQLKTNNYSLIWNCRDNNNRKVAQGVYFVTLETPKYSFTRKVIIAK
jgi:hypothetical protein